MIGGDQSISRKLTRMNMAVSGVALLLASLAFLAYEMTIFRRSMVRDLGVQARIVASNNASALVFDDPGSAEQTLAALKAAPNILSAAIYTPDGKPFAIYKREADSIIPALPPEARGRADTFWFTFSELGMVRSIVFQGKWIGTVIIRSDLRELLDRLRQYGMIMGAVLLMSLVTAFLLSRVFQRSMARPIVELADTARKVSRNQEYSVRAPVTGGHDEIAVLIDSFNEMLSQIQLRDAALEQASERLNLALKSSGVGTWSWDIRESFVWDDFMYPLFGLKPGTFAGTFEGFLELVSPDDRDAVRRAVAHSIERDAPYDIEFQVNGRDGGIRTLSTRGKVYRDTEGKAVRLTGVCWDVSDRKKAEEERQKFVSLVEQTDVFIGMVGLDGSVIYVNRSGSNLVGIAPGNTSGMPFVDLFPDEWRRKLANEILPAIRQQKGNWLGEAQLKHTATREGIDVLMNLSPVNHPKTGQLMCYAAIIRDITERKRLEEHLKQAQKLDTIGRLAGGVAHDFNNLLTIISGYAEMILLDLPEDHAAREGVEEISNSAERAGALTRQLLAFGRRQPSEQKEIVLNDLVQNVEKMLRRLIGEKVEVLISLNGNAGSLRADGGNMEQVIMNLAINARDAMPDGGKLLIETGRVTVDQDFAETQLGVVPGNYVMLSVSDTGHGMTEEVKTHIFEPFFTTKEQGKGTGLGLSTVYGIVKQSGGAIWVNSEPGQGSSFKMLFPAVEMERQKEEPASKGLPPSGDETILVVEDEDGIRKYLRQVLERRGYKVLEAREGADALNVAAGSDGAIDLLLTDVMMPGVGGLELADQFAKSHPEIPILFMSGYSDRLWQRKDTAIHFIQKPFTSRALLERIRKLMDHPGEPANPGNTE